MKARKETQSRIAEILGMTRQNFKKKLDGRNDWKTKKVTFEMNICLQNISNLIIA